MARRPEIEDGPRPEGGGGERTPVEGFSELPRHELRRRAFAGVFVSFSGGLLNLILAFGGNLVLARLLTPHDFGVVAIGSTVILVASAFAEGGLGTGLIRRPEPPLASELRTLTGIQLTLLTLIAALVASVTAPLGMIGAVTALMVVGMPIAGLQAAGRVALTRALKVRSVILVDTVGLATFYLWAISMVAVLDLGVWGLASAGIARAVAGTLTMAVVPSGALYRPTFERLREFREIIVFGIRFQAGWIVAILRDQSLNAMTALLGSVTTLGLWSLGQRLLAVPLLLQDTFGRIAFPTFAHVLASGEEDEVKPLIERAARLSGTCYALMMSLFVAVSPAFIPLLFGEKWSDAALVFPGACFALLVTGTAVNPGVSYLWAANRPEIVLRVAIVYAAVTIALSVVLLPIFGLVAVGLSLAGGALAESFFIAPPLRRLLGLRLLPTLPAPIASASLGATVGWLIASSDLPLAIAGFVAAIVAGAITAAVLAVLSRAALVDLVGVATKSLRHALGAAGA